MDFMKNTLNQVNVSENTLYNTIYVRYIFCSRQNSKLFFKVHEKKLFEFFNHLFN